jgi:hypothetical protein
VLKIFERFNPKILMQYNGMNTRTNTRRKKNKKLLTWSFIERVYSIWILFVHLKSTLLNTVVFVELFTQSIPFNTDSNGILTRFSDIVKNIINK